MKLGRVKFSDTYRVFGVFRGVFRFFSVFILDFEFILRLDFIKEFID